MSEPFWNYVLANVAFVLIRRWRWIAALTVLPALVAIVVSLLAPRAYTATLDVVPNRARTEVDYETRIRTVSGANTTQSGGASTITAERRQALAMLVRTADIEAMVQEELGAELPAGLRAPGELLRLVEGRAPLRTDVITIAASAPTPALAEKVVAAWGRAYQRHVNQIYAETTLFTGRQAEMQVSDARARYEKTEQALTAFTATSPLSEYERAQERTRQLINERQQLVRDSFRTQRRVEWLLQDAQALQSHLSAARDNSVASSNAVALTLLKMRAFTESSTASSPFPGESAPNGANSTAAVPPAAATSGSQGATGSAAPGIQLQFPAATGPTPTLDQQRADVGALVAALEEWRNRLQQVTADYASSSGSGALALRALEAELRDIESKAAQERAVREALTQDRELAREAHTTLLKKAEEGRVATIVGSGNEVSLASRAVVASPRSRGTVRSALFAASAGAVLGLTLVLLFHFVPPLVRRANELSAPVATGAGDGTGTGNGSNGSAGPGHTPDSTQTRNGHASPAPRAVPETAAR
jgi:uncharacterized protein involved in exopolysaccharide biosynthesis